MPKPKRSDVEAQIAALQATLDDAETDDEIWIKDESGREYKVTGRRATSIFAKLGLNDDPEGAEADDEAEDVEEDPKPKGGYFARGK